MGNVSGTPPSALQLLPLSDLGGQGNLSTSLLLAREGERGALEKEMGLGGCEQYPEAPPISPALMQAEAAQPLNHSPHAAL